MPKHKQVAQPAADWRDEPVQAEDVAFAYRTFLGRSAESDGMIADKVGISRRLLLTSFLTSSEFHDKLGTLTDGLLVGVDDALLRPLEPQLAAWLSGRFPVRLNLSDKKRVSTTLLEANAAVLLLDVMAEDFSGRGPNDDRPQPRSLGEAIAKTMTAASEIARSALFDADFYAAQRQPPPAFPALHYLVKGEAAGLIPSETFDPDRYRELHPELADQAGNLLLHFERVGRAAGWRAPAYDRRRARSEDLATVRGSALFDPNYYLAGLGDSGRTVRDPATHYLMTGEAQGLRPSAGFDPVAYGLFYPDIVAAGMNRLVHFEKHGRSENRTPRSVVDELDFPVERIDPTKPTVLLLLHEASHSGAPILGWNLARELGRSVNVVVVIRAGGTLEDALADVGAAAVGPLPGNAATHPKHLAMLARRLAEVYKPLYAIANSVETRQIAMAVRDEGVPIVGLVHEFASTNPLETDGNRSAYYSRCSAIVFSAETVRQSALVQYREITIGNSYVIPQGPSAVPPFGRAAVKAASTGDRGIENNSPGALAVLMAGPRGSGPFTIIGLGSVELRKGVDLFIATGTALQARHPDLDFRMIWIGKWDRRPGHGYNAFVEEQAKRSGLGDRLHFFAAVDDLEPAYARADALFLSSRLDPLPNISIDAAQRGLPILCFADASGMAELLLAEPALAKLVAPHLDTGGIADRIAMLALDPESRGQVSDAIAVFGRRTFDMGEYARHLDQLGRQAAVKFAREASEADIIEKAGIFDADFYLEPGERSLLKQRTACRIYLDRTHEVNFTKPALRGAGVRRPIPGFHPFIYASEAPGFPGDGSRDPLAHYIEHGQPPGRWMAPIIRPDDTAGGRTPRMSFRRGLSRLLGRDDRATKGSAVALHGHFFYPDDIAEFMVALGANQTRMDLFLTTADDASAAMLRAATRRYARGRVSIDIIANRGRDIAPFIHLLQHRIGNRYEIVGHVHGKKSLHVNSIGADIGVRWRRFLWQNLLGPDCAAADAAIGALRADAGLGLIFPQNEFTVPWDANLEIATELAKRMDIALPLPAHLDFPVGTMFWARTAALQPLVSLRLAEDDYPPEPLSNDGTSLHALERLIPFAAARAGYGYAMTYVPGTYR